MAEKFSDAETAGRAISDFIVADADYYETKARHCLRMAKRSGGDDASTLRSRALAFEEKARSFKGEEDTTPPC